MLLESAHAAKQPIVILELVGRDLPWMVSMVLMPLLITLSSPLWTPFRLTHLFFTWVVPVLQGLIAFDGVVSCLRVYDEDDLAKRDYGDEECIAARGSLWRRAQLAEQALRASCMQAPRRARRAVRVGDLGVVDPAVVDVVAHGVAVAGEADVALAGEGAVVVEALGVVVARVDAHRALVPVLLARLAAPPDDAVAQEFAAPEVRAEGAEVRDVGGEPPG